MAYDELIATITLVGSLLSCVATTCVLISYIVYHEQQRSFRHALVLNLALAEFINSLNNSISGIVYVTNHSLSPSPACTLNGWVGQLSVQAADFSILAIALVTVLTITRKTYMPNASLGRKVVICLSVWIVPIITSITATAMGQMVPVSGNWCWISSKRTDLRYALTHGWRFAIIFSTIGIYIYVYWYMTRHFAEMATSKLKGSYDTDPNSNSTGATGTTVSSRGYHKPKKRGFEVMSDEDLELGDVHRSRRVSFPTDVANFPGQSTNFPGNNTNPEFTFDRRNDSVTKNTGAQIMEEEIAPEESLPITNSQSLEEDLDLPMQGPRLSQTFTAPSPPPPQHPDPIHHVDAGAPVRPTSPLDYHTPNYQPMAPPPHPRQLSAPTPLPSPPPPLASPHAYSTTSFQPLVLHNTAPAAASGNPNRISTTSVSSVARRQSRQVEREIKRMLLLNAYPIMYVILWIPGIVNRLLEATGHGQNKTLAVLQSSSQYVGFANALTYGFNEHLRERIKGDLGRWIRGE
ncbi:G protein-coupled glucose receptor regulating Gpa2-domain-containing protein [Macrophomina phaseolina]|uniref:G protein-coupled glucose receptor regulating Gpa2-domain-containing protein n=1 Tax=Macrophomina phaseolina TaxID=35725 RepID=A0ABQ8GS42_9PEZI|nr:G protein-coupled glucose receptor regulating Gpa2-domain-containing protein [Macrophomina phaseolina]